jgi:hypothetical protein
MIRNQPPREVEAVNPVSRDFALDPQDLARGWSGRWRSAAGARAARRRRADDCSSDEGRDFGGLIPLELGRRVTSGGARFPRPLTDLMDDR